MRKIINTTFDPKALAQVYQIITMLENEDFKKIPKDLVNAIKLNKDDEYDVDCEELENGNILPDTIDILATIYTYYLATKEEKDIIIKLINMKQSQHKMEEDIFKNRKGKRW